MLSQQAMYIREDPGTRRMDEAVEAQRKALTGFSQI
jgi:hypothetical protein